MSNDSFLQKKTPTTEDKARETFMQIVCSDFDVTESWEEIKDQSFEELGFNSLDFVELIMPIEEELDIVMYDEDLEPLKTPTLLVDYVTGRLDEKLLGE